MHMRFENDYDYQAERAAAFATGIGLARLYLKDNRPDEALAALDKACDKVDKISRDYYTYLGFPAHLIDAFLGCLREATDDFAREQING